MKQNKTILRRSLLLAALTSAGLAQAAPSADIPYEKFTLDNGLTVVVHEDRKAPIVAVSVWYHVGSKDEKPGKTGFAHLFEHLMFQGSENFKDEFFAPMEKVGATDINGTTWLDRTNYFQNIPTTALDMALWLESDRMGHLLNAIDQKVLDEQRGVVQNEKRQGENEPYGKVFEAIQRASYPEGHPYRWDTIGSMEDLNAASLDDVKKWFGEYYGAANTTLILAGDIDLKTAKEKAQKYFGDIDAGPPLLRREAWVAARNESTRDVMFDRVAQTRIYRSWNVAELGTRDADLLNLVGTVLGGSAVSRLDARLVYADRIVDSVGTSVMPFELSGLFWIQADVKQGVDHAKVEAILDEELQRLIAEGPTEKELQRAKTRLEAQFVRGIERIGGFGGKADALAEGQVYMNDPGFFRTQLDNTANATAADVQAAAKRWLSRGDHTLLVNPFPKYSTVKSDIDRSKGLPSVDAFPDLIFPELQRGKLDNGIEVVLAERHAVPVVQIMLQFDAGFAADQGAKLGVSSIAMGMLDEGAGKLGALEFKARAEELGAQIGASSGLDTSVASLSALKSKLAESLALLGDMVLRPSFDASEFKRVQSQWLAGIAQEKTQPTSLAMRALPPLLYGEGHAYAMPLTGSGTEASIGTLTPNDLRAFQSNWLRADNVKILVAGDTTLDEITAALNKEFGRWKAPRSARPSKNIADVALPAKARVFLVDKPGAEQTLILAGQVAPSSKVANNLEIQTMNSVFGGTFTARLNMNLRENKHWAYGAYSWLTGALGQRPYLIYAPVQTDKTKESLAEMIKEARAFVSDKPATAEEIAKIKATDVRSLPGEFETAGAVLSSVASIELYDRPDNYIQTLKARMEAQKVADIHAAAKQVLKPEQLTWMVVGDLAKIEAGVRSLNLGEVKVLDADGKVLR